MRFIVLAFLCIFPAAAAFAQDSTPDLKGTWSGPFKSVIYGHNSHHPGDQRVTDPPRARDIVFTLKVDGQDGRVIWGESWSNPDMREPFAMAIAVDGKSAFGADTDGMWAATRISAETIEICYAHSGLSPSQSIVASCGTLSRSTQ
jgi:hypothetical protein